MPKIRIKYGENEIDIEGSDEFVKKQLDRFYGTITKPISSSAQTTTLKHELTGTTKPEKQDSPPSAAEFYKSKGRSDGVSKILIFAKYLDQYRNKSQFTKKDINSLVREAKISKDVHSQYFTNAVKQGLLRSYPGGKYSLTLSAEEIVASM